MSHLLLSKRGHDSEDEDYSQTDVTTDDDYTDEGDTEEEDTDEEETDEEDTDQDEYTEQDVEEEKGIEGQFSDAEEETEEKVEEIQEKDEAVVIPKEDEEQVKEKRIQEHRDYRRKLAEDPSFVPYVGLFWGHDNRYRDDSLTETRAVSESLPHFSSNTTSIKHNNYDRSMDPLMNKRWDHSGYEELLRMDEEDERRRQELIAAGELPEGAEYKPNRHHNRQFSSRGRGYRQRGGYNNQGQHNRPRYQQQQQNRQEDWPELSGNQPKNEESQGWGQVESNTTIENNGWGQETNDSWGQASNKDSWANDNKVDDGWETSETKKTTETALNDKCSDNDYHTRRSEMNRNIPSEEKASSSWVNSDLYSSTPQPTLVERPLDWNRNRSQYRKGNYQRNNNYQKNKHQKEETPISVDAVADKPVVINHDAWAAPSKDTKQSIEEPTITFDSWGSMEPVIAIDSWGVPPKDDKNLGWDISEPVVVESTVIENTVKEEESSKEPVITPVVENDSWGAPSKDAIAASWDIEPTINIKWSEAPIEISVSDKWPVDPVKPAVDNKWSETPVEPLINKGWSDKPVEPTANSGWSKTPVEPAVNNGWSEKPIEPVNNDGWSKTPVEPAVNNGWSDKPVEPASNDGWSEKPMEPAVNNGWSETPIEPVSNDGWSKTPVEPAVNDGWSKKPVDPVVKNGWSKTPVEPAVNNGWSKTPVEPAVNNGWSEKPVEPTSNDGWSEKPMEPASNDGWSEKPVEPASNNGWSETPIDPVVKNGWSETPAVPAVNVVKEEVASWGNSNQAADGWSEKLDNFSQVSVEKPIIKKTRGYLSQKKNVEVVKVEETKPESSLWSIFRGDDDEDSDVEIILEAEEEHEWLKDEQVLGMTAPNDKNSPKASSSPRSDGKMNGRIKPRRNMEENWRQRDDKEDAYRQHQQPMYYQSYMPMIPNANGYAVQIPMGDTTGGSASPSDDYTSPQMVNPSAMQLPPGYEANGMVYYGVDPSAIYQPQPYYYYMSTMENTGSPIMYTTETSPVRDDGWGPSPEVGEQQWSRSSPSNDKSRNSHSMNYNTPYYYYPPQNPY